MSTLLRDYVPLIDEYYYCASRRVLSFLSPWIVPARRPKSELTRSVPRDRYGLSWTGGKEGRGSEIVTVVCSTLVVYPRHSV